MIASENEKELYDQAKKLLSAFEYEVFSLKMAGRDYKSIANLLKKTPKDISNALTRIKDKLKKLNYN